MGKKANGEGSLYKIKSGPKKGTWVAAVSYRGKRAVAYGATREEASQKLIKMLAAKQGGTLTVGPKDTVGDFLTRWLEDVRPSLAPKTFSTYRGVVDRHLIPGLGRVKLEALTVSHVQKLVNDQTAMGHRKMAKNVRDLMRNALTHAMRAGLVQRNVAALARPPAQGAKIKGKFLSVEQAAALLKAVRGHELEALYVVALSLGLRQGEVLGLRWQDVDLDAGMLHVRYALQYVLPSDMPPGGGDLIPVGDPGAYLYLKPTKTELSRRDLKMPQVTVDALRAHRRRMVDAQLPVTPLGFVFVNAAGNPLKGDDVSRDFVRHVLPAAGLPHIRFYDLRHSAATFLLAQGVELPVVRVILGHSTIAQTSEYAKVMRSLHDAAADAMDRLLGTSETA